MAKVFVSCGFGPGISQAVAERFGREGFELVLIARTEARLKAAVERFAMGGIDAHAYPADLGDPEGTRELMERIGEEVGPITVYHWNAYNKAGDDVVGADVDALVATFNCGITSLVAGLKPVVEQMRAQQDAAVLITGGGFALYEDAVDDAVAQWNLLGLAVTKAAQHKLARTLARRLDARGVFVGEVVVTQMVKGTSFDNGTARLEASAVAERFWTLYRARREHSVTFP